MESFLTKPLTLTNDLGLLYENECWYTRSPDPLTIGFSLVLPGIGSLQWLTLGSTLIIVGGIAFITALVGL